MNGEFRVPIEFTAAARRVLDTSQRWSPGLGAGTIGPPALLLGLLAENECHGATILRRHGITLEAVQRRWPGLAEAKEDRQAGESDTTGEASTHWPTSSEVRLSIEQAAQWLAERGEPTELGTEHLLLGLVSRPNDAAAWLSERGVDGQAVEKDLYGLHGHLPRWENATSDAVIDEPIEMERFAESTHVAAPIGAGGVARAMEDTLSRLDVSGLLRVIDAAANRAHEGLRVVEDYVRFVLDDGHLTEQLKRFRHELTGVLAPVTIESRLAARETQADVGTQFSTDEERRRERPDDVVAANFCRLQESLRSLEEFVKVVDPPAAAVLEQLRYRSYTLQRAVAITRQSGQCLAAARLYVLLDGRATVEDFETLARGLVTAGADLVQLRDKRLDDRTLLGRARCLREVTKGSGTLFVVNDRPDLALLAGADGVHVGQEELPIKDVRALVGSGMLVGISVHSIEQARAAVLDGADYLGVGPTFPSSTKSFERFPGLELLRAVAAEVRLPAFAIGGIGPENIAQVLATGIRRIAVSGAAVDAKDPATAVAALKAALESGG